MKATEKSAPPSKTMIEDTDNMAGRRRSFKPVSETTPLEEPGGVTSDASQEV
jgi:hypothetical protein